MDEGDPQGPREPSACRPTGAGSVRARMRAMPAVAALVVLGACGKAAPPASGHVPAAYAAPPVATGAPAAAKPAPLSLTLKDLEGSDVRLARFKGKPIVVNFWATWCAPCRAEIPSLVELSERYRREGKDVVILGVSVDDTVGKLEPYVRQMKMSYPVLVGRGRQDVLDAFGPFDGIPVTVYIGRDGTIANRHTGIATEAQFEQEIEALH